MALNTVEITSCTATPLDKSASSFPGTNQTSFTTTTATTTVNNEVCVGFAVVDYSSATVTLTAYTDKASVNVGAGTNGGVIALGTNTVSSPGAQTFAYTIGATPRRIGGWVGTYKQCSSGGGGAPVTPPGTGANRQRPAPVRNNGPRSRVRVR